MSRTAVITGGSNGIGAALAGVLLNRGYRVFCIDTVPCENTDCTTIIADVRSPEQLARAARECPAAIDLLVNNAGVMRRGTVTGMTTADLNLVIDVHLKGALYVFRALYPLLAKDAVVLQMSSRHAVTPPVDPGVYGLAKQATAHVAGLIRRSHPNLHVKLAFPGPVDTELGRHQVSAEELESKRKTMITPEELSQHLWTLIDSPDYRCLNFDQKKWSYGFQEEWPAMPI